MEYIAASYQDLEYLGFEDRCSYYEKRLGFGRYIRVYCDTKEVRFFVNNVYYRDEEEITACVPIWAFTTIVKMVNKGLIC